ncbi:UBA-like_superfamily [Hexamita inflata]|uniref:UBA-like superfamily n=1 Tax=Hexamita inflata TaxID=28002 RepID=A0AA86UFR0_9EUKA|nr:UBA-like superfamily [Hexamita inflata]
MQENIEQQKIMLQKFEKIKNIRDFKASTGASDQEATEYLSKHQNNLEKAVQGYFNVKDFIQVTQQPKDVAERYLKYSDSVQNAINKYFEEHPNEQNAKTQLNQINTQQHIGKLPNNNINQITQVNNQPNANNNQNPTQKNCKIVVNLGCFSRCFAENIIIDVDQTRDQVVGTEKK